MQSSKSMYSIYFPEYKLDDEKLKKLQDTLLELFLDVKRVCDDHGIKYMLAGGSLLGAIRHEGFIPWDDDIDIMMVRSEYEKFRKVFLREMSDQYILAEPLCHEKYLNKAVKVFKKNTTYIEIPSVGVNGFNMVFADMYIIENIPDSKFLRKFRGYVYDFCFKAASVCIDYMYPSHVILEKAKERKTLKKYYNFRRRIGSVFAHIGGIRFYLRACEKLGQYNKSTSLMGVPSAFGYRKEIFPNKVFTETTTGFFCGHEVNIPVHYDEYLKNRYGDYMKIPTENEREIHVAYEVKV